MKALYIFKWSFCMMFLLSFLSLYSQNTDINRKKALELIEQSNFREASVMLEDALIKSPNDLELLYNIAYCYLNLGRPDVASNYLHKFLMQEQKDSDVYNLLGLASERIGYRDSAFVYYNQAIKLDKNFYEAFFNRGRCYYADKDYVAARVDFTYAKKSKVILPELYFVSGQLYYFLEQYDSAIIDLEKILNYNTQNTEYYMMLGNAYFIISKEDKKKWEKSAQYYTKALQLDSENVEALKNRLLIYELLELQDYAEADRQSIKTLQQKLGLNPASIQFDRLVSEDEFFSVEIPKYWKTFLGQSHDSDIIVFFDTTYDYAQVKMGDFIYDVGGSIIYYKNYFDYDSNNISVALATRDAKYAEYKQKISQNHKDNMADFRDVYKKSFNPNDKFIKEISKMTYSVPNSGRRIFKIEYLYLATSGKLLFVSLWTPDDNSFYFENVLDYIINSLTTMLEQ